MSEPVAVNPFLEIADMICESGGDALNLCYQCGTCSGVCPWGLVRDFSVRELIHLAQLGIEGYESEDLWLCATCGLCVDRCPRGVKIIDVIRSIRTIMGESGMTPKILRSALSSVSSAGNPWSGDSSHRIDWAEGLDLKMFTTESEWLYLSCCTPAYDPRNMRLARAAVRLFDAAGVGYGVLGNEEKCCGEMVRKGGDEQTFQALCEYNTGLFRAQGAKKIVVSSPHCLYTFRNEYPDLENVEIVHTSELFARLLDEGKLKPEIEVAAKVTYHDPCYLGRQGDIYDPPREILGRIPGLTMLEMDRNREESLCCGGGGGRMWSETPIEERFSLLRIEEAVECGAEILATACPFCILMFEDILKAKPELPVKIMDVSELLAESLGLTEKPKSAAVEENPDAGDARENS